MKGSSWSSYPKIDQKKGRQLVTGLSVRLTGSKKEKQKSI